MVYGKEARVDVYNVLVPRLFYQYLQTIFLKACLYGVW